MRSLFKFVLWLIILSPAALATSAWFALEKQPVIAPSRTLNHTDIARAQRVIREHDPRRLPAGAERQVRISERDLNLVANYLLQRVGGSFQARLHQDAAQLSASTRIPWLSMKPYLNIRLRMVDSGDGPRISGLRIGQVPVPDPIAHLVIHHALTLLFRAGQGELPGDIVRKIDLSTGQVALTYRWQPGLVDRVRDTLISQHDREAMAAYYNELVALQTAGRARRGSLSGALQPLFQLAQQRSRSGNDPVLENRALLLVLGAWAAGRGMGQLLPAEVRRGHLRGFRLSLGQRLDLAQHFLVSAAISSNSDSTLSDAVGLFKEVRDARKGSGFSFVDLAADRAGTRFGEVGTRSVASARRVQQLLAAGIQESDIIPPVRDLPENLSASRFKRRYGEIGSPPYNEIADEIERRLATCLLYQDT
jgi:hypothetical protein